MTERIDPNSALEGNRPPESDQEFPQRLVQIGLTPEPGLGLGGGGQTIGVDPGLTTIAPGYTLGIGQHLHPVTWTTHPQTTTIVHAPNWENVVPEWNNITAAPRTRTHEQVGEVLRVPVNYSEVLRRHQSFVIKEVICIPPTGYYPPGHPDRETSRRFQGDLELSVQDRTQWSCNVEASFDAFLAGYATREAVDRVHATCNWLNMLQGELNRVRDQHTLRDLNAVQVALNRMRGQQNQREEEEEQRWLLPSPETIILLQASLDAARASYDEFRQAVTPIPLPQPICVDSQMIYRLLYVPYEGTQHDNAGPDFDVEIRGYRLNEIL